MTRKRKTPKTKLFTRPLRVTVRQDKQTGRCKVGFELRDGAQLLEVLTALRNLVDEV